MWLVLKIFACMHVFIILGVYMWECSNCQLYIVRGAV